MISDYFDIFYAVSKGIINPDDPTLLDFARKKLEAPGMKSINISGEKTKILSSQLETLLKPVLREEDYNKFNLNEAVDILSAITKKIQTEN